MPKCRFCDTEFGEARYEAGYDYCMSKLCVDKGLRMSRQQYVLVCGHKSNYEPMRVDIVKDVAYSPRGR